jgi:hypothetical protein
MILLSITMFILGVLAFTDALFNYGNMFRMLFSALLIFMSVWVYLKTKDIGDLERLEIVTDKGLENSRQEQEEVELTQRIDEPEKKPEKVNS